MDVLLGSIDVRDLLSTSDLDESSPLSAPDLHLLIDRLNLRSLSIKSKVRSYVLSHRDDFAAIFSLSASPASSLASLADALHLLSDRPADLQIRDLAREICDKRKELEEKREALGVVEVVRGVLGRLGLVRERFGDGRLKEAAVVMKELKEALGSGAEDGEEKEPAVFGFLRKVWTDCFDELQGILKKNVEKAVQLEVENGRVIVKSEPKIAGMNDGDLYTTMEAMEKEYPWIEGLHEFEERKRKEKKEDL